MGYLHIENLYKPSAQKILMFKECYAMEKIHGTSANVTFKTNPSNPSQWQVTFFSGGESYEKFASLFDKDALLKTFLTLGMPCDKNVVIYGEAYGGKCQGMSATYGTALKFVAFDVCVGDSGWMNVPDAQDFCIKFGVDFVPFTKVSTDLKALDAERDAPSVQAIRNGVSMVAPEGADFDCPAGTKVIPYGNFGDRIANPKKREGVVLRPLIEMITSTGERIICKHKGDEFRETASPRVVDDPAKLQVLADADKIAAEWVTLTRIQHVLDKIPKGDGYGMELMPTLMKAMIEDVTREAAGEIVDNDVVRKAITKKTATMFKDYLKSKLANG